ncbi:MAG TPA: hypothetical protein VFD70_00775 [Anaerolineae bacterium]|nr:hypothetical protein [Anaerolineae bacterium]
MLGGEFTIGFGMLVWGVVLASLLLIQRSQATLGVGLVLAYFLNLGLIHLPGAYLYLDPQYALYDRNWVLLGFQQSTIAIAAFGIGAGGTIGLVRQARHSSARDEVADSRAKFNPWLHRFYLLFGLISYFVITPLARNVPTLTAVVAGLDQMLLVGICLGLWNAWQSRNWFALFFWIFTLGLLPAMTILSQGFIGYGTVALLTGLTFLASFFRPRWLVLTVGLIFIFVGLSAFVTYFRDRTEIRKIVWGGESVEERVGQVVDTFSHFEWFDPTNARHANYLDQRLNQNWLVGAAIQRLDDGKSDYKAGATIVDAAISLIPRALWSDKPVRAGSGNLVSDATGIAFDRTTSVGVGQVLEFYINFGTLGVVVGALLWGIALALLDIFASFYLASGPVRQFTLLFLVGLALNQPGGSLVDVAATAGAAIITALVVNDVLVPFFVSIFEEERPAQIEPLADPLLNDPDNTFGSFPQYPA